MPTKKPKNPYRQVYVGPPVVKEKPKPAGPPPPAFKTGDTLNTVFRPHFFDLKKPVVALDLKEGIAVGGWLVLVDTTQGERWLGASLFSKANPPEGA